jgi:hypothetical protein
MAAPKNYWPLVGAGFVIALMMRKKNGRECPPGNVYNPETGECEGFGEPPNSVVPCAPIAGVPGYGPGDDAKNCANCKHREVRSQGSYQSNFCILYDVDVGGGCVCDSWEAA